MHLYNAWLPPMVAEETKKEAESFASVVRSVKGSWRPDDPNSVYDTLKWIPIIDLFDEFNDFLFDRVKTSFLMRLIDAKSDISPGDVKNLVEFGLELFHASQGKLYPQVRWGRILITLLKKHGKKLSIGSASEIWSEFRPFLDNPWHYSAFEGSGFLRLFLTMNLENQNYFTGDWVEKSLNIWDSMPNFGTSFFCEVVLKLIAHGQYSKDEDLSDTVTFVTSILSYVEPSLVLPFIASRFEMALQTMTATHQLKTALTSVAFSGRAIFLVSTFAQTDKCDTADVSLALILNSLSNALLGIDANDPPKTLASMQLICSIYLSVSALLTAGVLTAGLISFRQGNSHLGQKLMRARVVVQGATVALMVGSAYYYGEHFRGSKK
uniref:HIG1 domain-containing protein n=1 Tax=Ananas comosus var. bracteatus TaxID=296719 RepID=A0A6V7P723_ANACO|nr:unnamed protein product [Ananas comosus var. bracteatus]